MKSHLNRLFFEKRKVKTMDDNGTTTTNIQGGDCKLPRSVSVAGLILAIVAFSLVGMINNLLIILFVLRNKAMHNPTNYLLANNALTELFFLATSTAAVSVLIYIESIEESSNLSELKQLYSHIAPIQGFVISPFLISAFNLSLLAFERHNALVHPMKINRQLTKRAVKIVIAVTWILAVAFSSLYSARKLSWAKTHKYVLGILIIFGAISLFTIASCYGKLIYGICISKTILNRVCSAVVAQDIEDKKNIVKMLMANTLLFAVTRLPALAFSLKLLYLQDSDISCFKLVSLLGHFSAFCHPLMIMYFSENYRGHAKQMLTTCARRS